MKVYIITSNQKTLNKVIIIGLYVFAITFILLSIMNALSCNGVVLVVLFIIWIIALIITITLLFIKWIILEYLESNQEFY